jgi:enterochelin esterase-like enzyme
MMDCGGCFSSDCSKVFKMLPNTSRHANFASSYVSARHVDVWVPPGLAEGTRLPVLYMHDGQNLFDPATAYGGVTWGVAEAMQSLIEARVTAGVIIVGVWNSGASRAADYMPQKPLELAVANAELEHWLAQVGLEQTPTSDAYLKCLITEIKPMIDATYPSLPGREHTFVMGSSMGGLISMYALCEYPEVFGGAACVSSHWPAAPNALLEYFSHHLPRVGDQRWYFDFGTLGLDAEYGVHQQRIDAVMLEAGYTARDWMTRKFEGADHNETSWRERIEIPLRFLLENR